MRDLRPFLANDLRQERPAMFRCDTAPANMLHDPVILCADFPGQEKRMATISRPQGELDIDDFCKKPSGFTPPLVNIVAF